MKRPDIDDRGLNDTQCVESIHKDHAIVETNLKLAEMNAAKGDNEINVDYHHDGEGEKTVDVFYMDADKKRDFLLYLNRMEDTDLMCVLDSGSAVNVLTNNLLFDEDITMNEGINIRNSSGKYRINKSGNAMAFGHCWYDQKQFINILSEYQCQLNENLEITSVFRQDGVKAGYDVKVKNMDVSIKFRWNQGIMVGSLRPLLSACSVLVTHPAKHPINLRSMAKYERAVNRVNKEMRRIGYQSKEEATISISRGYYKNSKCSARDFKYAADGYGPASFYKMGTATTSSKLPYDDKVTECGDNECVMETDIGTMGRRQFLISKLIPTHYGIAVPLGMKTKSHNPRARSNLLRALKESIQIAIKHRMTIKFIYHDGEKSLAGDSLNMNMLSADILQEYGAIMETLPKGVHAKNVENLIRQWKSKARQTNFAIPFMIPPNLVNQLGVAAMISVNMSPTQSNVGQTPPLVLIRGEPIDCNKMCVASFGEIVYTSEDNGVHTSSVQHPRSVQCIYLYPTNTNGGHVLVPVSSPTWDRKIVRTIKHSDVLKVTPMDVVVKMNRIALNQREKLKNVKYMKEQMKEEDEYTGYQDDLLLDISPELTGGDTKITLPGEEGYPDWADRPENRKFFQQYATMDDTINENVNDVEAALMSLSAHQAIGGGNTKSNSKMEKSVLVIKKEIDLKKAYKKFDRKDVEEVMKKELKGIVDREVWNFYHKSEITKEIKRMALPGSGKIRPKVVDGEEKLKGRYVGGGHRQDHDEYDIYREISSPTANVSSVLAVIANASTKGLKIMTLDIGQAYLNAEITEETIVMRIDHEILQLLKVVDPDTDYSEFIEIDKNGRETGYVRLNKALYGLIQSARIWYNHLRKVMLKYGYVPNEYDPCIFNKTNNDGEIISTGCFHVDDGLITAISEELLDELERDLKREFNNDVKIKRGTKHEYLGMSLDFSVKNKCHVTQRKFISDLVDDWNIKKGRETPARPNLFEVDPKSEPLNSEDKKKFHRGVAQALYLAGRTRGDILCPIIFLTSRVQEPTSQDRTKLIHVLEYLNRSKELGLVLGGQEDGTARLSVYCDASYAVHDDMKSHLGMYITYGRGGIVIKSNKDKTMTRATAESEIHALSNATSRGAYELEFGKFQQYLKNTDQCHLYEDNKSVIAMANNGRSYSDKTRHIKIHHYFVKSYLDNGEFTLNYCPTEDMIADILTKPLQGSQFIKLRNILLGYEITTPPITT